MHSRMACTRSVGTTSVAKYDFYVRDFSALFWPFSAFLGLLYRSINFQAMYNKPGCYQILKPSLEGEP